MGIVGGPCCLLGLDTSWDSVWVSCLMRGHARSRPRSSNSGSGVPYDAASCWYPRILIFIPIAAPWCAPGQCALHVSDRNRARQRSGVSQTMVCCIALSGMGSGDKCLCHLALENDLVRPSLTGCVAGRDGSSVAVGDFCGPAQAAFRVLQIAALMDPGWDCTFSSPWRGSFSVPF